MLTGEHRVAALFEVGRPGQVGQQLDGLTGDAVFAVVDVEVADGDRQFAAAVGIVVEELAQMGVPDLSVVLAQRIPLRRWPKCPGSVRRQS